MKWREIKTNRRWLSGWCWWLCLAKMAPHISFIWTQIDIYTQKHTNIMRFFLKKSGFFSWRNFIWSCPWKRINIYRKCDTSTAMQWCKLLLNVLWFASTQNVTFGILVQIKSHPLISISFADLTLLMSWTYFSMNCVCLRRLRCKCVRHD